MSGLHLAAGSEVLVGDRPWRVSTFDGRSVGLVALDCHERTEVTVAELLSAPQFRPLHEPPDDGPSRPALVEGLSESQLQQALWRRRHVMELEHGHPDGEWADAAAEPRGGYDPVVTTLAQRVELKARELAGAGMANVSPRTLRRWIDNYRTDGLLGLVDRRHAQLADGGPKVDPVVLQVLDELVVARGRQSTKRLTSLYAELLGELRRRHPERRIVDLTETGDATTLRVPSKATFYRLVSTRYRGQYLTGEAKARQSKQDMPAVALNPFKAARSGEVVQIDSTRLDLMALDRATGEVVRAELTLAVDAFDRSIRAVRVAAVGTRGVDVALMVYDMLCPVAWRPEWGEDCVWNYHGIPERLVVDLAGERLVDGRPANAPFGQPQTIVCDRGRIYLSKTFFAACEQFGISVQPAPPRTPNYKGIVEQTFDTFKEQVVERLPGHTGRGTHHRGAATLDGALLFLDQLEDLVRDWAVTVHHRRPHDGCRLPEAPQVRVTPNRMFEYSIARSGFITVPPSPERMVSCLPSRVVVIQDYGVNVDNLRYYHPVLDVWRSRRSPWDPDSGKPKHPVHYDPRDLSRVWFYDPDSGQWVALLRRNAMHPDVPFNDAALKWVKRLLSEDGYRRPDPEIVSRHLDAFLERQLAGVTLPQERKLVARMLDDARAASKINNRRPNLKVVDAREAGPEDPAEIDDPPPAPPVEPVPDIGDGPPLVDEDDDDIEPLPLVDDDTFGAAG